MGCICCDSEGSVLTSTSSASDYSLLPDEVDEHLDGPPIVAHVCQVCGYRWQRMHYPGSKSPATVHDLPNIIPGQPAYERDLTMLMTREVSGDHDSECFELKANHSHGVIREKITTREFDRELERRQKARRAAVCN